MDGDGGQVGWIGKSDCVTSATRSVFKLSYLPTRTGSRSLNINSCACKRTQTYTECNAFPCDTGSSREILSQDSEFQGFDLSLLTPDWTSKQGQYAADPESLAQRARWVRRWLLSRPEQTIVCIAHGDILRRITGTQHAWKNTETQLWTFDPAGSPDDAPLKLIEYITAEGSAEPTSGDALANMQFGNGAQGVGALPVVAPSTFDLSSELDQVAKKAVEEMEQRLKAK